MLALDGKSQLFIEVEGIPGYWLQCGADATGQSIAGAVAVVVYWPFVALGVSFATRLL